MDTHQRHVAPGCRLGEPLEEVVCQRHPGAYASARQLAQPDRGILLAVAKESPHAERLDELTRVGLADQAVRGADQQGAQAVRLEVHQVRPVRTRWGPSFTRA